MKVSVIIPVFNEERSIGAVLGEILALDLTPWEIEVLVSDDGSTDGSTRIVERSGGRDPRIALLRSPVNRGKTAAIRRALPVATGEVILVQDADREYSPADYPRLLAPFADPEVGAVYGSRFLAGDWPSGMRLAPWLANRCFTGLANRLYGGRLTDEGTGYKLFRREILDSLELSSSGFGFCPEVTAQLLRNGIRIVEVPVAYRARSRREGKKPGWADGLNILWTLLKGRWTRPAGPRSRAISDASGRRKRIRREWPI